MNTPLVVGALIVSVLLIFWLFSVLKATFKTALMVGVVVFALQLLTGVGPQEVWAEVVKILAGIPKWLQNWGGKYKPSEGILNLWL
ncbi:MAG: hypothetical protein SFT94_08985 [Pseudanabaenaceae cyanobacterium bins.68]|nr:hypothetical protein [Pseudanabaenaceae cyanobacterium bins.68]